MLHEEKSLSDYTNRYFTILGHITKQLFFH